MDRRQANIYKNLKMLVHSSILCFYKYWPDDGLLRPKIVANI
jgi:hypothetical protein